MAIYASAAGRLPVRLTIVPAGSARRLTVAAASMLRDVVKCCLIEA